MRAVLLVFLLLLVAPGSAGAVRVADLSPARHIGETMDAAVDEACAAAADHSAPACDPVSRALLHDAASAAGRAGNDACDKGEAILGQALFRC